MSSFKFETEKWSVAVFSFSLIFLIMSFMYCGLVNNTKDCNQQDKAFKDCMTVITAIFVLLCLGLVIASGMNLVKFKKY